MLLTPRKLLLSALMVLSSLFAVANTALATSNPPSFVADAKQAAPGMETRNGKLYAGPQGTRFEFTVKGDPVIQIVQPAKGLLRLIFPKTRTYMEMRARSAQMPPAERPNNPCPPADDISCDKQADEKIDGMAVERWFYKAKAASDGVTVWWDRQRRMPLRQQFANGAGMKAQKTGEIEFEGRRVEQWQIVLSNADGKRQHSYMLFAPDLGMPVMEQGAGGVVRELHNIKLQPLSAALFKLPAGFRKVTPPASTGRTAPSPR